MVRTVLADDLEKGGNRPWIGWGAAASGWVRPGALLLLPTIATVPLPNFPFPIFPTTHPSLSLRLAVEWVRPRIQVVVCLPLDPPQAQMAILAPHLPAPQTKFFLICALPVLKFNISLYVCVYGDTGASWRREYEPRREGFLFLASWALVRSSPRRSKHSGSATGRYRK